MSNQRLHLPFPESAPPRAARRPFGRYLVEEGFISPDDLSRALNLQRHIDVPLGEILVAEGAISRREIPFVLSRQYHVPRVDLEQDPPDRRLRNMLPLELLLAFSAVPWLEVGDRFLVATSRPGAFEELRAEAGVLGERMMCVVADTEQINDHLNAVHGTELARRAARRVPLQESCRGWSGSPLQRRLWAGALVGALLLGLIFAPLWIFTAAALWATVTLLMTTVLKAAALWKHLCDPPAPRPPHVDAPRYRLPRVSILVPLLREREIAGALLTRLSRLTYPKSLLQVVLVLEADDEVTRDTIARSELPPWISVIEVPQADRLKTKPRALNYALDFCTGSIIGVWDAEDAPEPDQIERVVARFQEAPAKVACLQGSLDYYNSRDNWLSRCFTIEYATWWRVLLPGMARLGLVVPLGGTTLFFRRHVLEELRGWDAHNVTEDADLGLRLARHGYVTELLPTVTFEEANCRAWPWVRQRSRWLKGYLITWCVHMRNPRELLRHLGPLRFLGVQTLFLATFSQFAMAPVLWSFWPAMFGLQHPVAVTLGTPVMIAMVTFFVLSEILNLAISMTAVSGPRHRYLLGWALTMPLYFTLGALAALKALYEFVGKPYYWDKTAHGHVPHRVEVQTAEAVPAQ